jgi:large subunit ribosomal protein L21
LSYAIINVGGKQYRVREGERLLVDRVALDDGATFTPPVLLVGGDGEPKLAPTDVVVTAKVLSQEKGPKIRIGKYKQRTGYKRHTGFRASLTQIQIESIGAAAKRTRTRKAETAAEAAPAEGAPKPRRTRTKKTEEASE